jgi:hypothetical protein
MKRKGISDGAFIFSILLILFVMYLDGLFEYVTKEEDTKKKMVEECVKKIEKSCDGSAMIYDLSRNRVRIYCDK